MVFPRLGETFHFTLLLATSHLTSAQLSDYIPITAVSSYTSAEPCIQTVVAQIIRQQLVASKCAPDLQSALCLCSTPGSNPPASAGLMSALASTITDDCPASLGTNYNNYQVRTAQDAAAQWCTSNLAQRNIAAFTTGASGTMTAGFTGSGVATATATGSPPGGGSSLVTQGQDTGLTTNQKIGIGIAGGVVALIIIGGVLDCFRRQRKPNQQSTPPLQAVHQPPYGLGHHTVTTSDWSQRNRTDSSTHHHSNHYGNYNVSNVYHGANDAESRQQLPQTRGYYSSRRSPPLYV